MTLERLKEKVKQNDVSWLDDYSIRAQVEELIRSERLSEDEITFLWQKKEIRHSLIRKCENLPSHIIDKALDDYLEGQKNISKTSFIQLIKNPNVSDENIKKVYTQSRDKIRIDLWSNIPKRLYDNDFIEDLLERNNKYSYSIDYSKLSVALIEIIKEVPDTFSDIIDKYILEKKHLNIIFTMRFLEVLSKSLFIPDDILDEIEEEVGFNSLAKNLVDRNNCSEAKKSKYILLGYA